MKTKALFGLWSEMKVPDINRILKPHGVRLVMKRSKVWGKQVSVTAHPVEVVKRARAPKEPAPQAPASSSVMTSANDEISRRTKKYIDDALPHFKPREFEPLEAKHTDPAESSSQAEHRLYGPNDPAHPVTIE